MTHTTECPYCEIGLCGNLHLIDQMTVEGLNVEQATQLDFSLRPTHADLTVVEFLGSGGWRR